MLGTTFLKVGSIFSNFDAKLFASKFGVFASRICASTPTEIVNGDAATQSLFVMLVKSVIKFVYYLIYHIAKFALNLVDFLELLVNKLAGISGKESYSVQADFSGNPIFKFLLHDSVLIAFASLLGIAILMLIVFTIIAIVKNEYDAFSNDKDNGKGPIIRRAGRSLFLFLMVPIFLFIFIIGCNAILNSANQAFKAGIGNRTLGGQIFVASTYSANRFKQYGQKGTRTPILLDFEDPADNALLRLMSDEEIAEQYDSWKEGKAIYNNFAYDNFDKFSKTVVYKNNKLYNASSYSGYEDFVKTSEEYMLFGDFIDYAVTNALEYYIVALDNPEIDWDVVKSRIGTAMYQSILQNNKFTVAYRDESDIANLEKSDGTEFYFREYVNSSGVASTPLADALEAIQRILALGEYSDNTFRTLERVDGSINNVQWKSEKAIDEATGDIRKVYTITKYSYNTLIDELQTRDPQTVVLKDGVFYDARIITDQLELAEANGRYAYKCNTAYADSSVDRVAVDYVLQYDNGSDYIDKSGNKVVVPKDILEVKYKLVSWPEKLYNDLLIIYSDIHFENYIYNDTWQDVVTSSGIVGSGKVGNLNIPTAFVSPLGLIMSELFLGKTLDQPNGTYSSSTRFGSIYTDETIDAIVKSIGGEYNYNTMIGQIEAFQKIYNGMMSQVLDDAAEREGVATDDIQDSVSLSTYKQYLASILLSDEFATFFANLSRDIINFNVILDDMQQTAILKKYESFNASHKASISGILPLLMTDEQADEFDRTGVLPVPNDDSYNIYDAMYYYVNDVNPFAGTYTLKDEDDNTKETYTVAADSSMIRSAQAKTYGGTDINEFINSLKSQRQQAIASFNANDKNSLAFNLIKNLDGQLFEAYRYLIKTAFSEAITTELSQSVNIVMNGYSYEVVLAMSTYEIVELAYGNQLLEVPGANEFFTDSGSLKDPYYGGIVKINQVTRPLGDQTQHDKIVFNVQSNAFNSVPLLRDLGIEYTPIYSDANISGVKIDGYTYSVKDSSFSIEIENGKAKIGNRTYIVKYNENAMPSSLVTDFEIVNSFEDLREFLHLFGNTAFALHNSSYENIAYGAADPVVASEFYAQFASFIVTDLFGDYPDLARVLGVVSVPQETLLEVATNRSNNFVPTDNYDDSKGEWKAEIVDWSVYELMYDNENNRYNFSINLEVARYYQNSLGEQITDTVSNKVTGFSCDCPSDEQLVKTLIEYWGFEYEKSQVGFPFEVQSFEVDGDVVVVDGAKYPVLANQTYYCHSSTDNSVCLRGNVAKFENRYFLIENNKLLFNGNEYEISGNTISIGGQAKAIEILGEKLYRSMSGDGSLGGIIDIGDITGATGSLIHFLNGKYYLVTNNSVNIGSELVGKTLVDYRRDTIARIANLDTRAGETEDELSMRFLSMFRFLTAEYVLEGETLKLQTSTYTKSLTKQLARELNRPDQNLVGKKYTADFGQYTKDEATGTVFIICTYDQTTEKYVPELVSTKNILKNGFYSRYVVNPYDSSTKFYPIVAQGIITADGTPTAIRLDEDGNVEFYRDNVYIVNASQMGITQYYDTLENMTSRGSLLSAIVNGITKKATGKTLTQLAAEKIPRLAANANLNFAYGSRETVVGTVKDAYFPMNYSFRVLGIDAFYSVGDLNIIILLSATIMITIALFYAVWGLIQRIFDIVVLFLVAPPIIATLPLEADDANGKYVAWRDKVVSSVLAVYGIVIGLNAFFIFVPIINTFDFFTPGSNGAIAVMQNAIIKRFANLDFVNYLFRVLFLLTAIGLVRRAPKMFSALINPGEKNDIFARGEATTQNVRATVDTVKDHVSGRYMKDKAAQMAGTVVNSIPGKAFIDKGMKIAGSAKDFVQRKAAYHAAIKSGVPPKEALEAEKRLKEKMKAQRDAKQAEKEKKQKALESREKERNSR